MTHTSPNSPFLGYFKSYPPPPGDNNFKQFGHKESSGWIRPPPTKTPMFCLSTGMVVYGGFSSLSVGVYGSICSLSTGMVVYSSTYSLSRGMVVYGSA